MPTKLDTVAIRKRLEADRASLQEQAESLQKTNEDTEDDEDVGHHYGDDGTDLFMRERDATVLNNAEDLIADIDAALGRLDDGTYGTCARCGKPINPARLEARPSAMYDLACQEIIDHERQDLFEANEGSNR